jgi:hypothetical protein
MGNDTDKLKFTARKPPEEDSGNQSGERSKTFTLLTPGWKLAIHALHWALLRARVVG